MLASSLIDSLDEDADHDVEQAWKEEVSRRIEQLESGEVGTIPWEDLHLRLAAKLKDAE